MKIVFKIFLICGLVAVSLLWAPTFSSRERRRGRGREREKSWENQCGNGRCGCQRSLRWNWKCWILEEIGNFNFHCLLPGGECWEEEGKGGLCCELIRNGTYTARALPLSDIKWFNTLISVNVREQESEEWLIYFLIFPLLTSKAPFNFSFHHHHHQSEGRGRPWRRRKQKRGWKSRKLIGSFLGLLGE